MIDIDFQIAPDAVWRARHSFGSPLGKDRQNRTRYYRFGACEEIIIRSVVNDEPLISPNERPTDFTGVWMDTAMVSTRWLKENFQFTGKTAQRLYHFRRYGQSWSITGHDRVLTDNDAMLEMALAHRNQIDGLTCSTYRQLSQNYHEPLNSAMEIFGLLERVGLVSAGHDYDNRLDFSALLKPFVGLAVVDNGRDFTELCKVYPRTITLLNPQHTVFVIDDEDDFFRAKLAMKGPRFLHRERSALAL